MVLKEIIIILVAIAFLWVIFTFAPHQSNAEIEANAPELFDTITGKIIATDFFSFFVLGIVLVLIAFCLYGLEWIKSKTG